MQENKCEYVPCEEKAVATESYKGRLFHVCAKHKKIVKKQKKADGE